MRPDILFGSGAGRSTSASRNPVFASMASTTPAVAGKVFSANSCRRQSSERTRFLPRRGRHEALVLGDEVVGVVLAPALRVHRDALLAVDAAQLALEAPLEPAPADVVAEQVRLLRPAGALQLLVQPLQLVGPDLVHVADEVAAQPAEPVAAVRRRQHVDAGEVHRAREVAVELVARDVDLHGERPEALQLLRVLELGCARARSPPARGRASSRGGRGLVALLPAEVGGERDVVGGARVDEDAPVAVEDQPAVGGLPDLLHEVLVGLLLVLVAAQDLELVEAAEEDDEREHHDARRPDEAGLEVPLGGAGRAGRDERHAAQRRRPGSSRWNSPSTRRSPRPRTARARP